MYNKHKLDFINIAVNRQKLRQKLIMFRNYGQIPDPFEIAVLKKQIKEETERLNNLIKEYLKSRTEVGNMF